MKYLKIITILLILHVSEDAYGFVRRDVEQNTNPLDSFQKNMDRFRSCVDQSLASAVGDVNEKQLQPIFNLLGDQLNRFSKAFDALTAPSTSKVKKR